MSVLTRGLRGAAAALVVGVAAAWAPPAAVAEPAQPAAIAPPAGPAPAWLVADTVTGHILGAQDAYSPRAPASTIKALLAMVVFDQLPLDTAAQATWDETDVECSCVDLVPGQVYTARQLLDALLIVPATTRRTCSPTCWAARRPPSRR